MMCPRRRDQAPELIRSKRRLLRFAVVVLMVSFAVPAWALRCPKGSKSKRQRDGRTLIRVCVQSSSGRRHGDYVAYHRRGRVKARGSYRHGRRHGSYRIWHRRGALVETGTYDNGRRSGERKRWYRSGKPRLVEHWLAYGKRDGAGRAHRSSKGLRHGPYSAWFRNSSEHGQYKQGSKSGLWETQVYTGERKTQMWLEGRKQGVYAAFSAEKVQLESGRYDQNRRLGQWQGWWPSGTRRYERGYVDGRRNGVARRWHPNAALAEQSRWLKGLRDGRGRRWSTAGTLLSDGQWRAGLRHGAFHTYYEDGTAQCVSSWRDNRLTGRQDRFWPGNKSVPMITAHWRGGQLDGPWARYNRSGALEVQGTFRDGALRSGWRAGKTPTTEGKSAATKGESPTSP